MKFYKRYTLLIALLASSIVLKAQFIVNSNGIPITNSALVSTNGIWQNTGPVINNGIIVTSDKWTNTGTIAGTGGFVLNYAEDQAFVAGSNSATIGFIEKTGSGTAIFNGQIYVRDSLKVAQGLIRVNGAADTLGIISTALQFVGAGAYVEGPMAAKGSGTFTLPVGLNGNYLPIKFYNSSSARTGVKVDVAPPPGTYSPGDAVESLFDFPYEWNIIFRNTTDTARFVEVQVPNSLISSDNVIVTQKVSGVNTLEALGKSDEGAVTDATFFKSFSRAGQTTVSLGTGFSGSADGDRAILQEFYTATQGSVGGWEPSLNWTTASEIRDWVGVKEKGGRIISINLPGNNIHGNIPDSFAELLALKSLNLSNNKISKLPDFTSMPRLTSVNVSSNNLDFADLEPIRDILILDIGFYENQAPLTSEREIFEDVNTPTTIDDVLTSGTGNNYKWKFRPFFNAQGKLDPSPTFVDAPGINNQLVYTTEALTRSTVGEYRLDITNSLFPPDFIISSGVYTVEATANINGVFNFGNDPVLTSNRPAQFKEMSLLQVNVGSKYDTIQVKSVGAGGTFLFNDVKLRDYLITGFADTLRLATYANAVATWYKDDANNGVIYWEEADTIFLADNIGEPGLTIKSGVKPPDPNLGSGIISGSFIDPFNDEAGRTSAKNKVSYGVSARRVQRAGRGTADITLSPPIAYVYTNDDGQFTIPGLDPREVEYRLNIQYPGYPMDPNSFIDIVLVDNLFGRQVGVEAEVVEGKINVRKLIITGWEEENHSMTAYPNPTVEYLYITGKPAQAVNFKLYDSNGRTMEVSSRWDNQKNQWELDVRNLLTGVYILDVTHQGKTEKLRIVVK